MPDNGLCGLLQLGMRWGGRLTANGKVVSGVAWTVGTYAVSVVVRFGSNILLSRLLNPELSAFC